MEELKRQNSYMNSSNHLEFSAWYSVETKFEVTVNFEKLCVSWTFMDDLYLIHSST